MPAPVACASAVTAAERDRPGGEQPAPAAVTGVTHWSARLLATELGIGFASVARIWRRWDLQPWRTETFKFSTDPQLDAKIRAWPATPGSPCTSPRRRGRTWSRSSSESSPAKPSAAAPFTSVDDLVESITAFSNGWNDRCHPFVWTKDADTIIARAHRK
jgi:hypothetical protein